MTKPNISIIIRTKNEEQWIPYCLEAVLNQNYKNREIIIVDDNSQDNTLDILKSFPVKIFHYDGDYLPGKSLNFGVSKAKGKFIVFLSGHLCPQKSILVRKLNQTF